MILAPGGGATQGRVAFALRVKEGDQIASSENDILPIAQYFCYSRFMDNEAAILALGALAQNTRLDCFRLLVCHEPDGLPAGEIARQLAVPQNTMSTHLTILARAGLVQSERQSRSVIYRASLDRLRALTLFLASECCGSKPELCAPLITELIPCCPVKEDTNV